MGNISLKYTKLLYIEDQEDTTHTLSKKDILNIGFKVDSACSIGGYVIHSNLIMNAHSILCIYDDHIDTYQWIHCKLYNAKNQVISLSKFRNIIQNHVANYSELHVQFVYIGQITGSVSISKIMNSFRQSELCIDMIIHTKDESCIELCKNSNYTNLDRSICISNGTLKVSFPLNSEFLI